MQCPPKQLDALRNALSPARFGAYEKWVGGDPQKAMDLYCWNVAVCEVLFFPLQIAEIVFRNAVSSALENEYGSDWPNHDGFKQTLPDYGKQKLKNAISDMERYRRHPVSLTTNDIVAALSFGFWVHMLTSRHQDRIWSRQLEKSFPYLPVGKDREYIYSTVDDIRRLRNRISHHEPIHYRRNLQNEYDKMVALISCVSPSACDLVNRRSQNNVLSTLNASPS